MSFRSDRVIKLFESIASETPASVRDRARQLSGKLLEARTALPLAPGDVAGNYEVVEVLGSGGQAVVYRARHRQIGRHVALKVPRREVGDRLLREAQLGARLEHAAIARVEDIQLEGAVPYMVLELCEKGSLEDLLDEHPSGLPLELVSKIATQVLEALSFAHKAQIVHRDVKPANILFDKNGQAKVADFGIGTMAAADGLSVSVELSQLSLLAGTPLYVAPEQENPALRVNGRLDGRADLFSFGKVLFQMLTGASPRTIRPPSRLRKGLDAAWDDFVFKLLEERPQDRYLSAEAALASLPVADKAAPLAPRPHVVIAPREAGEHARLVLPAAEVRTVPQNESPGQREARIACQVFAALFFFGFWFSCATVFVTGKMLPWDIRAGGFAAAAAFSLIASRRASRAKRPSVANAVWACSGAGLALAGSALCIASALSLDHADALTATLFIALPFQAIGFTLAWLGYASLAPSDDAPPSVRERALETAAVGAFMALVYGLLSHLSAEAQDPLAVLPAVATVSVLGTVVLVRAFLTLREAQRQSPPAASGETGPGAVLGLVCSILVAPVLLAATHTGWVRFVHPDVTREGLIEALIYGVLLAAALELSAVFLALYARGAIDRSSGSVGGKGLTTATIVIALLNLLAAVAILLAML
jgi:tRNA A-37 threonylcarbamoyl transferase component Bud32